MIVYQVLADYQRRLDALNAPALRLLAEELTRALAPLERDAERLAADVLARQAADDSWRAYAAQRARAIAAQVQAEIDRVTALLTPYIAGVQVEALSLGAEAARAAVAAQLGEGVLIDAVWQRASTEAARALVGATSGGPLAELLAAVGKDAGRTVRTQLLSGLLAGKSPRAVGRIIADGGELSRARAETISRNESSRAYTAASLESYRQNPTAVIGYRRLASMSARSCAACLALDGTLQDTSEVMAKHVNDRCSTVPEIKPAILGQPARPRELGAQWFDRQPDEVKAEIVGPGGLAKLKAGASLGDFVDVHQDRNYGPTLRQRPLAEIG